MDHNEILQTLSRYGLDIDQPETLRTAWQLEDDGYIHNHLVDHLSELNRPDCIGIVLDAETPEGKNGWFQAREALGQIEGFVTDVEKWHSLLRAANRASSEQSYKYYDLGAEIRSVLFLSTLRSLPRAEQIDNATPPALPLHPQLSPQQRTFLLEGMLRATQRLQNEQYRTQTLIGLIPQLLPHLLPEARNIALTIQDEGYRTTALTTLLPYESPEQALALAREAARPVPVVPAPPPPAVPTEEALRIARTTKEGYERARRLRIIALRQPPEQQALLFQEALEAAQSESWEWLRSLALKELAPHLPATLIPEALALARAISAVQHRSIALASLLPHLSPDQYAAVLLETLEVARRIEDEVERSHALRDIALSLPPESRTPLFQEALEVILSIEEKQFRTEVLAGFLMYLPLEQQTQVVQESIRATEEVASEYYCSLILRTIVQCLIPQGDLSQSQIIPDVGYRSHLMKAVIGGYPFAMISSILAVVDALAWETPAIAHSVLASSFSPLSEIGGESTVLETIYAIEDIERWWPCEKAERRSDSVPIVGSISPIRALWTEIT